MGAWPAQVRIGLADAPAVLRLLAPPAVVATAVLTAVSVAIRARSIHHLPGKERR
jgi:hypothetical protein